MDWNFKTLGKAQRYKLLAGLVTPRPIALVTTLGEGVVNAAPFSFFNVLGIDPPTLVISIGRREFDGSLKDTARNIIASSEFVVHLVDESMTKQMHGCSIPFPPDVSEINEVGFTAVVSRIVSPPRIVEASVAMECRLHSRVPVGSHDLFIGLIEWMHVREGILNPDTLEPMKNYHPIGRLAGNRYVRTQDWFSIDGNEFIPGSNK